MNTNTCLNPRPMRWLAGATIAAVLIAGAMAPTTAVAEAAAQDITAAEKLLFQTRHLQNVAAPKVLRYRYVRQDAEGAGFSDEVLIDVAARNSDGSARVSAEFLHGERQLPIPAVQEAQGNPALLGFLERDIAEMKRVTGGSTSYFRKRIRMALAESARVEEVTLDYGGRQVRGQKVAIQPYLNDPMGEKMPKYVGKQYVFILSDAIPGSVYRLSATVPAATAASAGKGGSGTALIEETMTFNGTRS
jgi:hypothetical protein